MARTIERAAFVNNPVPELLPGNAFTEEAGADTFVITDLPFTPSSGQGGVLAHVLRADDTAIAVDGTSDGTTATVTLDADCYHVAGRLSVAIYITDANEQSQCVYACVGNVWRTVSDTELDSGTEVPTLAQLETAYANCVAATAAAQGCVSYEAQTGKTDAEKHQARTNIGAASENVGTRVLDVNGLVNYGFEETEQSITTNGVTVTRKGTRVTLNGTRTGSGTDRYRLNGALVYRTGTPTTSQNIAGFYPLAGHRYRIVMQQISGTAAYTGSAATPLTVAPYKAGTTTVYDSEMDGDGTQGWFRRTVFGDGSGLALWISFPVGWVFTNAVYDIQLEEVTGSTMEDDEHYYAEIDAGMFTGYIWSVENGTSIQLAEINNGWAASRHIPVTPGDRFKVIGIQGGSSKPRLWCFVDDSDNIISMERDKNGSTEWTLYAEAPAGATSLVVSCRASTEYPYVWVGKQTAVKDAPAMKLRTPLAGKTVAVIGDSISTNGNSGTDMNVPEILVTDADVGVQLSAYVTYADVHSSDLVIGGNTYTSADMGTEITFTPVAADVGKKVGVPVNYNDNSVTVWWEVMQKELDCSVIPVCWSGSSITSHDEDEPGRYCSHAWHDSQIRKCGARVPGSMSRTAPDMIIIARGTNDWTHEPYATITEDYFKGPEWTYPDTDVVGEGEWGFLEGICLTVKKLRAAYPLAQVWLATLPMAKRINDATYPPNNGVHTIAEYNKAIREAADFLGCGLIDFAKDGITYENIYSGGYATDSAEHPTHPSDKGHRVMGMKAIADIRAQYNDN